MIEYEQRPSLAEIKHYNGLRSSSITGNIDPKKIMAVEMLNIFKSKFTKDKGVKYTISGRPVEEEKIFAGLKIAAGLSIIGIFFILSLMFDSYTKPFLILSVIPFGVVGIFLSFYFHNLPLSMFAGIGLIGLSGIVINDSIILVDHISNLMKENGGFSKELLIRGAKERLRPISLTTISTVLAVAPTAYAIGGYDPLLSPLSLAILYGLLFGTTVVLLFMPTLYLIGNEISEKFKGSKMNNTTLLLVIIFFGSLTPDYAYSKESLNISSIANLLEKSNEYKIQDEAYKQAEYYENSVDGILDGKLSGKVFKYSSENYPNPPITLDSIKEGLGISLDYEKMTSYGFKIGVGASFEEKVLGTNPSNKQFNLDATDSVYKAFIAMPLWRNFGSREYHFKKKAAGIQKNAEKYRILGEKDKLVKEAVGFYWSLVKLTMEKK